MRDILLYEIPFHSGLTKNWPCSRKDHISNDDVSGAHCTCIWIGEYLECLAFRQGFGLISKLALNWRLCIAVKIVLGRFGPLLPSRHDRDATADLEVDDAVGEGDVAIRSLWLAGAVGTDGDPD